MLETTAPQAAPVHEDRWGEAMGPRGAVAWHRYRHVESNSGGTYGWSPLCHKHCHQYVGPTPGQVPPKGAKVCRRCKRDGPAEWELTPQASDWLADAFGAKL